MLSKQILLILCTIMYVNAELQELEEMYLNFFVQMDSVKKSIETLKLRIDLMEHTQDSSTQSCYRDIDEKFSKLFENFDILKKGQADIKLNINLVSEKANEEIVKLADNEIKLSKESQDYLKLRIDKMEENFRKEINKLEEQLKNSENDLKLKIKSLKEENVDLMEKYTTILDKCENTNRNEDDVMELADRVSNIIAREKENYLKKPLFDVRVDKIPKYKNCHIDNLPSDCAKATECSEKSGYYAISTSNNANNTFMAYCDEKTDGGDWIHILRRVDGSENFYRNWWDYVTGFGNVENEYWIGLKNLHELTHKNGQQELYVYIENFEGESRFARYDNFIVGNEEENYILESLGEYAGTAGNDLRRNLGSKFSTYDSDNDEDHRHCAKERHGGFWFEACTDCNPTGKYFGRQEAPYAEGVFYVDFGGPYYSHKTMIFMIRKKK